MATFNEKQEKEHRQRFIEECLQKAWSAACHADWISKGIDGVLEQYQKLQEEDKRLEAAIQAADLAIDAHMKDNREKRKTLQERRNAVAKEMQLLITNAQEGQRAMQQLFQSVESSLALAKHAETWEWKEIETAKEETAKGAADE